MIRLEFMDEDGLCQGLPQRIFHGEFRINKLDLNYRRS